MIEAGPGTTPTPGYKENHMADYIGDVSESELRPPQASEWQCSIEEYHADPRVGRSMLTTIESSPAEYYGLYVTRKLQREPTEAQIIGNGVHCRYLEPDEFEKRYTVRPPGIDGRTTAGKIELAKWRESSVGKTELTQEQMRKIDGAARALARNPLVQSLTDKAVVERAVVWTDSETGIDLKARTDLWIPRPDQDSDLILDIKTAADPSPEEWRRSGQFCPVRRFGYDMQAAHYTEGTSLLTGRPCGFGLIVVGTDEPFDVYLYDLAAWIEIGHFRRRRALQLLSRCLFEDDWTRPEQTQVIPLVPTIWDDPQGVEPL